MTAPERIYRVKASLPRNEVDGLASWPTAKEAGDGCTEYIRADLIPATPLSAALAVPEVRALVEEAFAEGFAEGYGGTWIEGDYSHAWKKFDVYKAVKLESKL